MEGGKAMALHRPENEEKALEENSRLYIEWGFSFRRMW